MNKAKMKTANSTFPCLLLIGLCLIFTPSLSLAQATEYESSENKKPSPSSLITLDDVKQRALAASPQIGVSQAAIDAAEGAREQAGLWQNPEAGIDVENAAGSGSYRGIDSAEITYGLSQTIEIGGKRQARVFAAEAAHDVAVRQAQAARLTLMRDVTVAYMETIAAIKRKELAEEQRKLATDVKNTVAERVSAAREPKIQQSKAEVEMATSGIALSQSERELLVTRKKLESLVGSPIAVEMLDQEAFLNTTAPATLVTFKDQLTESPEAQIWQARLAEQKHLLDIEKAASIPDPTLNAGVRDYRDSGDKAFVVGFSIPIPVLNQNQGNIHKARAGVTQTESEAQLSSLTLSQELEAFWHEWNTSAQEASTLKEIVMPEAKEAFALARQGYRLGKFPYLDVLDSQRTLFEAKAQYYDALLRAHTAKAEVERLTSANDTPKETP